MPTRSSKHPPLLIPTTILEPSVHSLETYISHTHMTVEVSSYEEFLVDRHDTNHTIKVSSSKSISPQIK
jgi:hypothetical protein